MATIRDIAKAAGVSAMTVSAVLNNTKGAVSPNTRSRVLGVVEEMGYHPNAIARALTRRAMDTIGVVMAYADRTSLVTDRYFAPVLDGIFDACKGHGQRPVIITENTWEEAGENLASYFDGHCDGLIFVLPTISNEFFASIQQRKVPFVIVGETRPDPSLSVVDLDNVAAGRDATAFLLDADHRRIGFFSGDPFYLSSGQREEGYRQALAARGIPADESLILKGGYSIESGYARMNSLIERFGQDLPTAVFCADDWIAVGARHALAEHGLSVPEDVSLIGVNDNREAELAGLTTVHQPLRRIGQRATEIVLSQIRNNYSHCERELLCGDIVVRRSVGKPCTEN